MISNKKTFRIIYLWWVILSIFLIPEAQLFATGNNMEIPGQQPQLLPAFNTVGFQIRFKGDANKNGQANIRYREPGGAWQEGHPCIRAWYSDQYEWAGRIFYLKSGTQYEIEVKFIDPDGVTGENPKIFAVTSRSEPVVGNNGGQTYHVSSAGDDNNNGAPSAPFKTIEKGISMVNAGGTVVVHEGTYRIPRSQPIEINKSGTEAAPIIIKAADGEKVIIDSFDSGLGEPGKITWHNESSSYPGVYSAPCDFEPYLVFYKGHYLYPSENFEYLVNGKANSGGWTYDIGSYGAYYYSNNRLYIKFPVNFRNWSGSTEDPSAVGVQVALSENGFNISGDYVVLDGIIVQHTKTGIDISGDHVVIRNVACQGNWLGIEATGYFTLIDNCEIGCSADYWYREWQLGHDILQVHGVNFDSRNGGNNVIRNSRIYGVENGLVCDSPWSNSAFGDPSYNPGVIIINNEFDLIGDDAVEADGPGYNVVILGNYFHGCFNAISTAPIGVGPVWAIRNIIYGVDRLLPGGGVDYSGRYGGPPYGVFKFASGARPPRNGRMLLYHNTIVIDTKIQNNRAAAFSRVWDNAAGLDVLLRNNSLTIKEGGGNVIWIQGYAAGYTFNLDIDYDNLWRPAGRELAEIIGTACASLADMQRSGYELNGMSKNPQHIDPAHGNFGLPEGSSLTDAGLRIPGINDDFYGVAPDIGAVEFYSQANVERDAGQPYQFDLQQNYPNPFNPATEIGYTLPGAIDIDLSVFDVSGRCVKTLVREKQSAGAKIVIWNGKDENNNKVSSGMYFYRLRAGEFSVTRKMLLVR